MDYGKYKEIDPLKTVSHAKEILADLGIVMKETPLRAFKGACAVRLEDVVHGWMVGGKGTTYEYCMASGYGESMERLQGYIGYDLDLVNDDAQAYREFYRAPDEEFCTIAALETRAPCVWEQMKIGWVASGEEPDDAAMVAVWEELVGRQTPLVPYWAVRAKRTVLLPDEVIAQLDGTNGLASGNAPHEALCESMAEILERYVLTQVFENRLTMPVIPRAYIKETYPSLDALMGEIEERGNFHVVAREGSMGKGYPVVSVALIDQDQQRYHVQFGAHPTFAIALERCLTELLEGYVPGDCALDDERLVSLSVAPGSELTCGYNMRSLYTSGTAFYPLEYFAGEPSWPFTPWSTDGDFTNEQGVCNMALMLGDVAGEVYVRDQGYLGFNAYRVFVPGVTRIFGWIGPKTLRNQRARALLAGLCDERCSLTQAQRCELIEFLECPDTDTNRVISLRDGVTLPMLHAALLHDAGELQRAAHQLRTSLPNDKRARCIALEMDLAFQGMDEMRRDEVIEQFFGARALSHVKLFWRAEHVVCSLYRSPFKRLFVSETVSNEEQIRIVRERVSTLHRAMKDKMAENVRDQTKLGELF